MTKAPKMPTLGFVKGAGTESLPQSNFAGRIDIRRLLDQGIHMLGNIHNTVKTHWEKFYSSLFVTTMNTEQQRKLSWARHIESYEAVPDPYRFFFEPLLAEGRAFPYTILTPTFEGLLQSQTTEKLVCDLDNEIYVLERMPKTINIYAYPLKEISRVEVRVVLLDSQIRIFGTMKDGTSASVSIRFNTATENLLAPILEKMRRAALGCADGDQGFEIRKLDYLEQLNYKFMNYARRSLLQGERILQVILQSRIQTPILTIFGKTFYRTLAPAHLTVLTDRELILIREEHTQRTIDEYGKVWDYIRLNKIIDLCLGGETAEFPKLCIKLPGDVRVENLYQASAMQEVNQLLTRFAGLTRKS